MAHKLPSGKWREQVRVPGFTPESATFRTKREAEAWGASRVRALTGGHTTAFGELRDTRVRDLLLKFQTDVTPLRKGRKWEDNRITALLREPWTHLDLTRDVAGALRAWRDSRLGQVKAQTVNRDLNLLGSVFTMAAKEWGLSIPNFAHQVKRPKVEGGERDVTWSDEDLKTFLDHFDFDITRAPITATDFVPWVVLIARVTGLRRGNICEIHRTGPMPWLDLSVPCVHYPAASTKNATDYDCPLNKEAVRVLSALSEHRRDHDRLIEPNADTITTLFIKHRRGIAKEHPHMARLRIHDQRHTWTTKMVPIIVSKGGGDMLLAKISGRRSVKSLFRYFNPEAKDMAKMLD